MAHSTLRGLFLIALSTVALSIGLAGADTASLTVPPSAAATSSSTAAPISLAGDAVKLVRRETRRKRSGAAIDAAAQHQISPNTLPKDNVDALIDDTDGVVLWKQRAEYFASLVIGSPPRRVRAQVDTGSAFSVIPGAPCFHQALSARKCSGAFDTPYDAALSNTSRFAFGDASCPEYGSVVARFADGSAVSGCFVEDLVGLGVAPEAHGEEPAALYTLTDPRPFTLIYVVSSSRPAQRNFADVGPLLGVGPVNPHAAYVPPGASIQSLVGTASFALYLNTQPPMLRFGPPNIALRDPASNEPLQAHYAPLLPPSRSDVQGFRVRAAGLRLGSVLVATEEMLGGEEGAVVIDSGSIFIAVPTPVLLNIHLAFRARYCEFQSVCAKPGLMEVSSEGEGYLPSNEYNDLLGNLPSIVIDFETFHVAIPPAAYLLRRPCAPQMTNKHCYILALTSSDASEVPAEDRQSPGEVAAGATSAAGVKSNDAAARKASSQKPKAPLTILGEPFLRAVSMAYDAAGRKVGFHPSSAKTLQPPSLDVTTEEGKRIAEADKKTAFSVAMRDTELLVGSHDLLLILAGVAVGITFFFVFRRVTMPAATPTRR